MTAWWWLACKVDIGPGAGASSLRLLQLAKCDNELACYINYQFRSHVTGTGCTCTGLKRSLNV